MIRLIILFCALLADRVFGDPDWLWRRYPHPVVWMGKAIEFSDSTFNRAGDDREKGRQVGAIVIVSLLLIAFLIGVFLSGSFHWIGFLGMGLEVLCVAVFLAQKSLSDHVLRVAEGLENAGLEGGRRAVSMIVGRDPASLDQSAVARAAIESLAENYSDGITAPVFWYLVLGLPGLFTYKMLNTADSMIGHKSDRYLHFGWAAARLDDLANLPASRLSALFIALSAALKLGLPSGIRSANVARRDASLHRSPNAGYPESAMAGALNIALAGPRIYGGETVREPMLNAAGNRLIGSVEIRQAVDLYWYSLTIGHGVILAMVLLAWSVN